VFASLLLIGALALFAAAAVLLIHAVKLRRQIKAASWLVSRVAAALGEAERAGRLKAELADTP
jgi:hypothetical protein